MKKGKGLLTFIIVVATMAAAAALIVTHIEKICAFLEACKRKTREVYAHCCCGEDTGSAVETDFEDVEI